MPAFSERRGEDAFAKRLVGKVAGVLGDGDALFADYLKCYHPEYKVSDFVVNGINAQYYNLQDLETATA